MTKEPDVKSYGMFNGRRSADQYVKAYLKGVMLIAGVTLAIAIGIGTWVCLNVVDLQLRVTQIESSRFTVTDGAVMLAKINDNRILFSEIKAELIYINKNVSELTSVLRRAAPA